MPNPSADTATGTYDFGPLGKVKGLKINGRYATQQEALTFLNRNRMTLMTPQQAQTAGQVPHDPGFITGLTKRATGMASSILPAEDMADPAEMLAHSSLNPLNIAVGLGRAEKRLGKQTGRYSKDIFAKGATAGERSASAGKALVSGLSMLNPFAAQTVVDVNEMQEQGHGGEAAGVGVFDIFTLLPGLRVRQMLGKRPPEFTPQVNRLTRALGESADPRDIQFVAEELNTEARANKLPRTVDSVKKVITGAKSKLDTKFNLLLHPYRATKVVPTDIANAMQAEANAPDLAELVAHGDADAIAEQRAWRAEAVKWSRPYSLEALNTMRTKASAARHPFTEQTIERQGAKLRSSTAAKMDSIVERGLKDTVYDFLQRQYPNEPIRQMKGKQSALITLESVADEQAKTLRSQQAVHEGSGKFERISGGAYMGKSGKPGLSLHSLQRALPGGGPETAANRAVRKAFPGRTRQVAKIATKTVGRAVQLSPRDERNQRRLSLERQLKLAERYKDSGWTTRIRKAMQKLDAEE